MKKISWILGFAFGIFAVWFTLSILSFTCGAANNAGKVLQKEVYPEALLKKYEWFKNASSELDKKNADISIYTVKINNLKEDYKGSSRKDWDRTDKETFNIWSQELAGIKASYNSLAAEYNSQMSKINWAFCNVGKLPPGAITPLNREYKCYNME